MIKRAVIRAPARGYVDGRFIGEEKEPADTGRARGKGGAGRRGKANSDSVLSGDNIGNTTAKRRTRSGAGTGGAGRARTAGGAGSARNTGSRGATGVAGGQGARTEGRADPRKRTQGQALGQGVGQSAGQGRRQGQAKPQGQGQGQGRDANRAKGRGQGQGQGQRGPRAGGLDAGALGADGQGTSPFISDRGQDPSLRGAARTKQRRGSTGKKSPFRTGSALTHEVSPTQGSDLRRLGDEAKSGQFADALAASANVKRERLHKVLAQSGHGSRRDMEIIISSGRVMVNGIVATTGTQVAPGDNVLVDQRHVKLKFIEDMPRVLLYHKPEGEIVTTNDPGNRITVFDNLPRVETGKWVAVGRLDINTSGLLIFTTSGELANRFMHPRYEVEREYAVRILGELTEEQTQQLLAGVKIEDSKPKNEHGDDDDRFNRIDADSDDDEDDIDDEIYDIDPDEDAVPQLVQTSKLPLDLERSGNQALDSDPLAAQRSDEQPSDDQPLDAQPVESHPFESQPLDARFLGTSVPTAVLFPRNPLAKFDVIEKRGGEGVNQWYHVVIREGRNREVRKMFESLGLTVSRLIRTRFGKVELPPRLLRGKMVELDESQVRSVLASAGMKVEGPVTPLSSRGKNAAPREKQDPRPRRDGADASGNQARPRGPNRLQDQTRPRDQNRARHQKQRAALEGTSADGASAVPRIPNDRRRHSHERSPRNAAPTDMIAADSSAMADADLIGNGNGNSNGNIDAASNEAARSRNPREPRGGTNAGGRGRGNSRGGRGRRGSGAAREPGANPGNAAVQPNFGASETSASTDANSGGGSDGSLVNASGAPRPDNRSRGKSRRTFRGRRRTNTGAGGSGMNEGGGSGNDGGNSGNDGGGNAGNTE